MVKKMSCLAKTNKNKFKILKGFGWGDQVEWPFYVMLYLPQIIEPLNLVQIWFLGLIIRHEALELSFIFEKLLSWVSFYGVDMTSLWWMFWLRFRFLCLCMSLLFWICCFGQVRDWCAHMHIICPRVHISHVLGVHHFSIQCKLQNRLISSKSNQTPSN